MMSREVTQSLFSSEKLRRIAREGVDGDEQDWLAVACEALEWAATKIDELHVRCEGAYIPPYTGGWQSDLGGRKA